VNIHDVIEQSENNSAWCTNIAERHDAISEIIDLCYDLLPALSASLNKIHKKNYSEKYWHIILGAWLYEFSSVVYDRKKLLDGHIQTSKIIKSIGKNRIIPRDTYESLKLSEVDEFNTQLFSDIQSETIELGPINSQGSDGELKFNTNVNFATKFNLKEELFNFAMSNITNKSNIAVSLTAIPIKSQWSLFLRRTGIRPIKPLKDSPYHFSFDTNIEQRAEISFDIGKIHTKNHVLKSILKLLPFYIPKCYVEGYQKLEYLTSRYKSAPKAIIITTECYGRYESFMNWVAKCSSKGTKVCSMQHGGNYGFENRAEYNFVEIAPFDIFYTWGWLWPKYGIKESQLKKMPSFHLWGKPIKRKKLLDNKILFCSTAIDKTLRSMGPSGGDTYYKNQYIKTQLKFYGALDDDVKKIFHIRAYKDDLIGSYSNLWLKNFPDAIFEDLKVDYLSQLSGTTLYVSDHMSTTWIEALAHNVPIVIYFNISMYDMTPEMRTILDMLNKVSVLHYKVQSAAETINEIYMNAEEWWNEKYRAETVKYVRNKLIASPDSLIKDWSSELKNL